MLSRFTVMALLLIGLCSAALMPIARSVTSLKGGLPAGADERHASGTLQPDGAPVLSSVSTGNPTHAAALYGLPADTLGSLTSGKLHIDLTGTRKSPQVGTMVEINDNQVGPQSSPTAGTPGSASYGYGCTMMRPNWNRSAITGEMDCHSIFMRQANSDVAGILSNIGARSGFATFSESATYSFNTDGSVKKGVNLQLGVVNSRDGGEYGVVAQAKAGGRLDTAVLATQNSLANWLWGYRLTSPTGAFLAGIRGADGAFIGGSVVPFSDLAASLGAPTNRYRTAFVQTLDLTEVPPAAAPTPLAGHQTIFVDQTDHKLKRKDSGGHITVIG